ncbi:oligosaccharyltransferase 48 kDa subunit beta domain-containing protein [Hirsutella rhossiliensis]|uniref:Dolichyl-diphosphooligosaccharide--protein glycosyltransferase subunit WBP1 n=1 Tax=Hirsutella rhossiliensis TaxID=111463 RepID=A0A9P8SG88_9HYPO|nr:oligosaccharyltransferase 48 kDa subunit beta domain-containing protein [Hirsutella rhossiliensis]KAH0961758.1 oligosaccharyltransferase 48 kDa subunit beta domain-containing protein [Hirsutella rhossiliensis]
MRSFISLVVLLFAAAAAALSTAGNRLLAVLDNVADRDAYSQFLGDLKTRGFALSYETPRSEGLQLFHVGERNYDHLIFFPTKVKGLGPNLTPGHLLNFVKAGGNILVAMSSTTPASTSITQLLSELDVFLPAERTGTVVDHFNYDTESAAEAHDVLVLDAPTTLRPAVKGFFAMPGAVLALPRASGHILGQSKLLTPLLRAPSTAYSYNPKEHFAAVDPDELFAAGQQLHLASAVQSQNSARVAILGSAEMLQDAWMDAKVARVGATKSKAANREFAKRLTGWAFQETGVLRVNSIEHRLRGHNETNPTIYRVKNDVSYSISISEYSWDKWIPFALPGGDRIQLEFSMLSPFHRLDLVPTLVTETATVFGQDFTLPDQHGIFNFMVDYKRPLVTHVEEKRTVSVRHMAHDEWPRSFVISGAWPWLSGIAATVSGFVGFCAIWMYSKPAAKGGKKA